MIILVVVWRGWGSNIFDPQGPSLGKILDLQISSSSFFSVSNDGTVKINTTTTNNTYKLLVDSGAVDGAGIGVRGDIKATGFIA